jgi:hypothetical protein
MNLSVKSIKGVNPRFNNMIETQKTNKYKIIMPLKLKIFDSNKKTRKGLFAHGSSIIRNLFLTKKNKKSFCNDIINELNYISTDILNYYSKLLNDYLNNKYSEINLEKYGEKEFKEVKKDFIHIKKNIENIDKNINEIIEKYKYCVNIQNTPLDNNNNNKSNLFEGIINSKKVYETIKNNYETLLIRINKYFKKNIDTVDKLKFVIRQLKKKAVNKTVKNNVRQLKSSSNNTPTKKILNYIKIINPKEGIDPPTIVPPNLNTKESSSKRPLTKQEYEKLRTQYTIQLSDAQEELTNAGVDIPDYTWLDALKKYEPKISEPPAKNQNNSIKKKFISDPLLLSNSHFPFHTLRNIKTQEPKQPFTFITGKTGKTISSSPIGNSTGSLTENSTGSLTENSTVNLTENSTGISSGYSANNENNFTPQPETNV